MGDVKTRQQRSLKVAHGTGETETNAELLERLATHREFWMRHYAAEIAVKPSLLRFLATDSANEVRIGVSRNKATPIAVLKRLRRDADEDVRWFAEQQLKKRSMRWGS